MYVWCCRCKVWKCCTCDAYFTSSTHLSLHLLLHSSIIVEDNQALTLDSSQKTLICALCNSCFSTKRTMEFHLKIEHGSEIYCIENLTWFSCPLCCNKLYMQSQGLVNHMKIVHKQNIMLVDNYVVSSLKDITFPCQECKQPNILSKQCTLHKSRRKIRKFKENEKHVCWYCGKNYPTKLFLSAHISVEHGRLLYSNPDLIWYFCKTCCNKLYMRSQDIVKHMRNVHGLSTIQTNDYIVSSMQDITSVCERCDKSCILSKACSDHREKKKMIHKPRELDWYDSKVPFDCKEHTSHLCQKCDVSFDQCSLLWSHMFVQHRSYANEFICNLCVDIEVAVKSVTFLTRHMYKRHKKSLKLEITPRNDELKEKCKVIVDGSEMFKCQECGTVLKNVWSLREHMMIHTGEKPHVCQVCQKSFRNRGKLNVHYKRVHEQIRTHQCNHCGRAFSDKSNLTVHIRTHTDEKKYMCELCGAEFAQWATLYNHKFTHNDVKFKCTYCEKVYNNPSNLQRHIKTHTDNSLYICEICGKDFGTSRYLKRHKDTHNTVNSFLCEICNAGFKIKKHLTQHYKSHTYTPTEQYQMFNQSSCEKTLYKL